MAKSIEWQTCFVCMEPHLCEQHHLIPQVLWPNDQSKLRDFPGNLVPLCKSCHEHVTWGFRETAFIGWILSQIRKSSGPMWARMLLVKYYEAAVLWLQAKEQLRQAGISLETQLVSEQIGLVEIIAKISEFETSLFQQRVRTGLANAAAKGRRLGRPPTVKVEIEKVLTLRASGASWRA